MTPTIKLANTSPRLRCGMAMPPGRSSAGGQRKTQVKSATVVWKDSLRVSPTQPSKDTAREGDALVGWHPINQILKHPARGRLGEVWLDHTKPPPQPSAVPPHQSHSPISSICLFCLDLIDLLAYVPTVPMYIHTVESINRTIDHNSIHAFINASAGLSRPSAPG